MISRRLFIQALSAPVLLSALPRAALADQLDSIKKAGVLRVGVPQDYPPFGFMGSDMTLQGYDIEMAKYFAKALGVKCRLLPVTSANRIPFMQSGKADIIVSTLGKSPARHKVIDFSIAYAPTFQGVFGPASIKASKPADLAGHSIGFTRGANEDQALTPVLPKSARVMRYEDNNTTVQAYLTGQVECVAMLNLVATALTEKAKPGRRPALLFKIRNSPCFAGIPKGQPALRAALNAAITKAFKEGTLEAWSRKYLKGPIPKDLLTQEPEQAKF